MKTPQWIKKLGGHAGELYVAAELSKRAVPNALLPENFSDDDILAGTKDGLRLCYIQVKACHPARSKTFILRETDERWSNEPPNRFCVFVWLGVPKTFEAPRFWIATKREVGLECSRHSAHGTKNWERRFSPKTFPAHWENNWKVITDYLAAS
ncbi:MAG: hypothetical protein ACYC3F_05605 [Gemmatimonadaceae bacterium]